MKLRPLLFLLPLSLSNSVIATHQTVRDLFPERAVSVRRIGVTYGLVNVVNACPQPVLAVILVFEGLTLLLFIHDVAASHRDLFIALLVALCAAFLPQGYLIGLLLGLALAYAGGRSFARRDNAEVHGPGG